MQMIDQSRNSPAEISIIQRIPIYDRDAIFLYFIFFHSLHSFLFFSWWWRVGAIHAAKIP